MQSVSSETAVLMTELNVSRETSAAGRKNRELLNVKHSENPWISIMETEKSFAREEQRMFHVKQSKKQHKDSQKGFMYETLLEFDTECDVSRETIYTRKTSAGGRPE